MRLSIVVDDSMVSIDGVACFDIDLSFMPSNVHAVQWYGSSGELELKDLETGKIVSNLAIDSLEPYQQAIDSWNAIISNTTPATQSSTYP